MSNVDRLSLGINDQCIKLVQGVGIPRSMSTALGRAINESGQPSVFINEPFNRENADIETAAKHILGAVDSLDVEEGSQVFVYTKNMASYLSLEAFEQMESLSSATIWNIRHPLVQIGSLLTRIVNDNNAGPGFNILGQNEIEQFLDEANRYLIDSDKSRDYSKTGWASISSLHQLEKQAERITIDGDNLVSEPEIVLSGLCNFLGIRYSPKMIKGWETGFINVINIGNEQETYHSAWTDVVAKSDGIQKIKRQPLDIESLPPSLKGHIENVAIPTYIKITNNP